MSAEVPEFEFWVVGNPSFPPPHLLTADELIVDGVLLPLHLLPFPHHEPNPEPDSSSGPSPSSPPRAHSFPSKRWKAIFTAGEMKEKKKERKDSFGGPAELNIHIWPFARSRSAGNGGKTRASATGRKASSAPCSRSNSQGESSKPTATATATPTPTPTPTPAPSCSKKCTTGSSWMGFNGGIHLGRSRPVWQLRRSSKWAEPKEKNSSTGSSDGKHGGGGGVVRALNLNVNTCIGCRTQASCCGGEKERMAGDDRSGRDGGNGGQFSLRTIFSKKVY